jgi:AraC-like DNA-binding protein
MLSDHCYELLKTAASESMERIRRDRAEAPENLQPVLAYIEDHLFDPTLKVGRLQKACGIRDSSLSTQFRSATGQPPRRYIEDRRLETGRHLLVETDLKIWRIAVLLGFSELAVFSRAFERRSGQRPSVFRTRAREEAGGRAALRPIDGEPRPSDPEWLRRAAHGGLAASEASPLIRRLLRLYPSCRGSSPQTAALREAALQASGSVSDPLAPLGQGRPTKVR